MILPPNIEFKDRELKEGETSHFYCEECGEDVHIDFVYTHKCRKPYPKD